MTPKLLLIALLAWAAIAFVALAFVVVRGVQSEPDAAMPAAPPWLPSRTQVVVTGLALVLVAARLMLAGGVSLAHTVVTAALVAVAVTLLGRSMRHSRTRG